LTLFGHQAHERSTNAMVARKSISGMFFEGDHGDARFFPLRALARYRGLKIGIARMAAWEM
jgi:hypothetical protein